MGHFENIWLENRPAHFKRIACMRFVDDTFLLFQTEDHVEKFKNYLIKQHKNIKFTSEIGENGSFRVISGYNKQPWKQWICNIRYPQTYIQ